uniref:Uncharacterized protein n=1 Tax=Octopus bimaculoides TaxID=37653 RepID=A0A0L8G7R4_OCTBM
MNRCKTCPNSITDGAPTNLKHKPPRKRISIVSALLNSNITRFCYMFVSSPSSKCYHQLDRSKM